MSHHERHKQSRYDIFLSFHGGQLLYHQGAQNWTVRKHIAEILAGFRKVGYSDNSDHWFQKNNGNLSILFDDNEIVTQ